MVHDARTVRLRPAREVVLVRGDAPALTAGGPAPDVAHAVLVGQEPQVVADPHGAGVGARPAGHQREVAAVVVADPDASGAPALVALPPRGIGGVALHGDGLTALLPRDRGRASEAQVSDGTTPDGDRRKRCRADALDGLRGEDHLAPVRSETDDVVRGAVKGQPRRRTALGRHAPHARRALVDRCEREQRSVGRVAGVGAAAGRAGEPPRDAALGRRFPEVPLGAEDDPVAVDRRVHHVREVGRGGARHGESPGRGGKVELGRFGRRSIVADGRRVPTLSTAVRCRVGRVGGRPRRAETAERTTATCTPHGLAVLKGRERPLGPAGEPAGGADCSLRVLWTPLGSHVPTGPPPDSTPAIAGVHAAS